jgi:hypothetical protein
VKALEEILNEVYTSRNSRVVNFFKNLREEAEGEANE